MIPGIGKKQLNLIIGIDTVNANVKVMRIFGTDIATARVDYLPAPAEALVRGDWPQVIGATLSDYMAQQHIDQSFAVRLVLPNRTVGNDIITMPAIKRAKMQQALEVQLSELYPFYKQYKYNQQLLDINKTNATFEIIMVNKEMLNGIYKALSECKLYVKNATYAASCALNAVFALRPRTRKGSFIFADLKSDHTVFTVSTNGATSGFSTLPFGHSILESPKMLMESTLYNNDIAQVAVLNATERARRKKMTIMGEDDENIIEETALHVNDISAAAEPDEQALYEEGAEERTGGEGEGASGGNTPSAAQTAPDHGQEFVFPESGAEVKKPEEPKTKTYVRKTRRLPAFMQRPVPDTPEGIVAENFRFFVKRALLMRQQDEQSGYMPEPEYILFNMPQQYGHVIEYLNQHDNSGIELRCFSPEKENNPQLTENLDLFGALYMDHYNKKHNF